MTGQGPPLSVLVDALVELRRAGPARAGVPAREGLREALDVPPLGDREAAGLLRVSRWTVRRWAEAGLLEAVSTDPLTVTPGSAAWLAAVLRDVGAYAEPVRAALLESSLDDRAAALAAVRGRGASVDITDAARSAGAHRRSTAV
jgi:hypothetical protein